MPDLPWKYLLFLATDHQLIFFGHFEKPDSNG